MHARLPKFTLLMLPWCPQAYGAGDVESLPAILQRAVCFCLLHCVPLTALLLVTPAILRAIGVEPLLCTLAAPYLHILIPRLWIEAFNRCPVTMVENTASCCTSRVVTGCWRHKGWRLAA